MDPLKPELTLMDPLKPEPTLMDPLKPELTLMDPSIPVSVFSNFCASCAFLCLLWLVVAVAAGPLHFAQLGHDVA